MNRVKVSKDRDCDTRHLRMLGVIVAIVLAICTGTLGYCRVMVSGLEARVRKVEQNDAANAVRFEAIRAALDRIEKAGRPGGIE